MEIIYPPTTGINMPLNVFLCNVRKNFYGLKRSVEPQIWASKYKRTTLLGVITPSEASDMGIKLERNHTGRYNARYRLEKRALN